VTRLTLLVRRDDAGVRSNVRPDITRSFSVVLAVVAVAAVGACSDRSEGNEVPLFAARIIALVEAGDSEGLTALAQLQSRACEISVESQNQCEGGDAVGTIYDVFPGAECQGFWSRRPGVLMEASVQSAGPAYAVARLGAVPQWAIDTRYRYGNQVVIFEALARPAVPAAVAIYIDSDAAQIVGVQVGCGRADQFLEPGSFEEAPTVIWRAQAER
jgi:hypothetical protein